MSLIRINSLTNATAVDAAPTLLRMLGLDVGLPPVPRALQTRSAPDLQAEAQEQLASYGSWSSLRDALRQQSRNSPTTA
jgi:hypothetical protein